MLRVHDGMGLMTTEKFLVSVLGSWFNTGLVIVKTSPTVVSVA